MAILTHEGLIYFIFWILSLRKAVLLRGIQEQLSNYWTKCSNPENHILILNQNSQQHFTSSRVVLMGAVVLHLMYRWDQRGINSPTVTDLETELFNIHIRRRKNQSSSLSPPLLPTHLSSGSPHPTTKSWEKRQQTSIGERIYWFPHSKEHLVHVWPAVLGFVTLGACS
jgi:hypothetical protein